MSTGILVGRQRGSRPANPNHIHTISWIADGPPSAKGRLFQGDHSRPRSLSLSLVKLSAQTAAAAAAAERGAWQQPRHEHGLGQAQIYSTLCSVRLSLISITTTVQITYRFLWIALKIGVEVASISSELPGMGKMNSVCRGHWAGWQVGERTGLTAPEPDNGTRGLAWPVGISAF